MISNKKQLRSDLHIFLSIVTTLLIIGSLFVYSASSVYALETFGSSHYFVKRQLIGLFLGLCGIMGIQLLPVQFFKKMSPIFFLFTLGLTALTLLPAFTQRIHGSSRWLTLNKFTFQPSELLKIAFVLFLAYLINTLYPKRHSFLRGYLPFLLMLCIPSIILLKQPDFGLTVTLFLTTLIVLFLAQFELRYIIITLLSLVPIAIGLIIMRPYRLQRIITFLNPWDDPKGSGFQIIQSLIAIGSGGIWGIGIAHSKQKFFYLPMQHTDFIFSIIAEETGFIGCLFLIILYLMFLYFGIRIAGQLTDRFAIFSTLGFVILISLQAYINMAVASGLLPTKGIGLPFVSYGNTALVCNLLMIGIIMRIVNNKSAR